MKSSRRPFTTASTNLLGSRLWAGLKQGWLIALACAGCGGNAPAASDASDEETTQDGESAPSCPNIEACEEQCQNADAASCEWAGRMYETGEGAPQDYEQAARYYDKACSGGIEESCAHLAMMYDIGLAVEESPERATELYQKACANGNRWACKRGEQLEEK